MGRQKRKRSEGLYAATFNNAVLILPARGVKTALRAGFAVQPLSGYLSTAYRTTDNALLKALIAANYPECTDIEVHQDELPFD